jgi:hypothetical protein
MCRPGFAGHAAAPPRLSSAQESTAQGDPRFARVVTQKAAVRATRRVRGQPGEMFVLLSAFVK